MAFLHRNRRFLSAAAGATIGVCGASLGTFSFDSRLCPISVSFSDEAASSNCFKSGDGKYCGDKFKRGLLSTQLEGYGSVYYGDGSTYKDMDLELTLSSLT